MNCMTHLIQVTWRLQDLQVQTEKFMISWRKCFWTCRTTGQYHAAKQHADQYVNKNKKQKTDKLMIFRNEDFLIRKVTLDSKDYPRLELQNVKT